MMNKINFLRIGVAATIVAGSLLNLSVKFNSTTSDVYDMISLSSETAAAACDPNPTNPTSNPYSKCVEGLYCTPSSFWGDVCP